MVVRKKGFFRSAGFSLLVIAIVLFAVFPFIQMLSTSLKYQLDWGNPSLIPRKINLESYKELLSIGQSMRDVPESVQRVLDNPKLTAEQRRTILKKYQQTGDIFPFLKYFRNSMVLSVVSAFLALIVAVLGAYSFSRVRYRGRSAIQRGVLFVYMFGGILILIPLYQLAVRAGLASTPTGTFITMIVLYMVQTLPVSLYMLGTTSARSPFRSKRQP